MAKKLQIRIDPRLVEAKLYAPERLEPVKPIIPVRTTTSASLYGVLIYIYPDKLIGQLLDYYEYTTVDGHRVWHITYGISALYIKIADDLIIPAGLTGFITPDMYDIIKTRKPMVLESRHAFGELPQVPVETMVNLEHVWSGKSNILIIDPHGILGRRPSDIENAYIRVARQVDMLRKMYSAAMGELEYEKSRRISAENQLVVYRTLVDQMRAKLTTLQEAFANNEQQLLELYNRLHGLHRRVLNEAQARIEYETMLDETRTVISNTLNMMKMLQNYITEIIGGGMQQTQTPPAPPQPSQAEEEEEEGEEGEEEGEEE